MPFIAPIVGGIARAVGSRALGAAAGRGGMAAAAGRAASFAKSPVAKAGAVGYIAGQATGRNAAFGQGQQDQWFPSSL